MIHKLSINYLNNLQCLQYFPGFKKLTESIIIKFIVHRVISMSRAHILFIILFLSDLLIRINGTTLNNPKNEFESHI